MQKTKRIGLNLLYFRANRTGGGETYAKGLLSSLQRAGSEFEFFVFVRPDSVAAFDFLEPTSMFHVEGLPSPDGRSLRHLWEQSQFSRICDEYCIDLLHSLGNVGPL